MLSRLGPDLSNAENRRHYEEYLFTYGDHVVTRVSMGVRIRQKTYINKEILKAISISHFHEQSGWSFLGIFGSKHQYDVMEQMKASARVEVKVDGRLSGDAFKNLKLDSSGFYSFALKDLKSNLLDWTELRLLRTIWNLLATMYPLSMSSLEILSLDRIWSRNTHRRKMVYVMAHSESSYKLVFISFAVSRLLQTH
jgi:hypothetical protein